MVGEVIKPLIIALVENDPLVRVPLAQGLEAGYSVVSAAIGPEALTVLEEQAVGVAVIDEGLPGR